MWTDDFPMSDDRHRATVRMPQEAYDRLCAELPSFSTDTARFQYLLQFYFDYLDTYSSPRNHPDSEGPAPPACRENRPPRNEHDETNCEPASEENADDEQPSEVSNRSR